MSNTKFLLKTAYRDSRKNRGKLVMFMSSIVLGIAALVAINSFNYNLVKDIDRQAAQLLGADLSITGNRPAPENLLSVMDSLPGEKANEMDLLSMAFIPKVGESQFVRIKAVEGSFPFYGKLLAEPGESVDEFRKGSGVLVDNGLMLQHGLVAGDSISLGTTTFQIAGRLKSVFGGSGVTSSFAPPIYIAQKHIAGTGLIKPGSLVNYAYYRKLPESFDIDSWKDERSRLFRSASLRMETVADRKENLNEAFSQLNYFLNLVALISLLLGCIGVASSVFIYVKNKVPSIAVFRCLGMRSNQAFAIYFSQIVALGVLGVISGAILGSIIQVLLPKILNDFLPFKVSMGVSWNAILEGLLIGTLVTVLFSLLPLIAIRKVSPLRTLRAAFDEDVKRQDPLKWAIYVSIVASIFAFLWLLTKSAREAGIFTGGLLIAFMMLFLSSRFIMWGMKKYFPRNWSFVFRQGLSNIFRPNNQTQTLLVSIGLGTSVLTTLYIIQGLLLTNVSKMDAGNQPNMILYGIESDQREGLSEITANYGMPLIQEVPIVTMKLEGWKGRSKAEWLADTSRKARGWAIHREARVTYRDTLDANETLISGTLARGPVKPGDSIFISLGDGYADGLDIGIGDEVIWNVQGTRIKTYVKSLRKIDFANMNARFFIVFPTGVLEDAPQFRVLVTKSPDTKTTAAYRSEVVRAYPNVSVVDLGMILSALSDILKKISYIIQFMAAFSILTGLIVLISSLLLSKFQRIRESVLLRTIGASRKQILQINATEYMILGILSAATGILISIIGSYLLARFQLELPFTIQWFPIIIVFLFVVGLTTIIGLLNTKEVVTKSPLEVLRKEVE